MELKFRTLRPDEIELRIGQQKPKGISFLLYKDARCDMSILDETVGALNWQRCHSRDNANCVVSIWDEDKKQWISKEDTGIQSRTDAEKGLASDSFKRACVNWGVGRELYSAPFVWIDSGKLTFKEVNGKQCLVDKLSVSQIEYDDRRNITKLVILSDRKPNPVYTYQRTADAQRSQERPPAQPPRVTVIKGTTVPDAAQTRKQRMDKMCAELGIVSQEDLLQKRRALLAAGLMEDKKISEMADEAFESMLDAFYKNFPREGAAI